MRIAIVDDVGEETALMKKLLYSFADEKNIFFDISCFISGKQFLEAFDKERFDVVYMDIYMNGMTGIETAKALRKRDSHCFLIFLSRSTEHMSEAFSCHAFEYIQKPADYARVREVMTDVIKFLPDKFRSKE